MRPRSQPQASRMCFAALFSLALLAPNLVAQQPPVDHAAMRRDLDLAQQRWRRNRPAIYEFTISMPGAQNPWHRTFHTFRVDGERVVPVASAPGVATGRAVAWTTVDGVFEAVTEHLDRATYRNAVEYDEKLGFPLAAYVGDVSFTVVAFRALTSVTADLEPSVVVEHINHCGFGLVERTALGPCPDYSIAMWGDGVVGYIGGSGVATVGRREHRVAVSAVQKLHDGISNAGFFNLADDYSSIALPGGLMQTIDHSAEKWITVSSGGRRKTVHDFYGAPDVLLGLEQAIEALADSYRYTKLKRPPA